MFVVKEKKNECCCGREETSCCTMENVLGNESQLKEIVRTQYAKIAESSNCCTASCGCGSDTTFIGEDYNQLDGYNPDADLGLGCGLPTKFAKIKKGDTVVDLGSGAGNDCFVARAEAGETGRIIGIDFTPEMLLKARDNAKKRGFANLEFVKGDIDDMPLEANIADVVVSNCVLNLVPNKQKVFNEIYRILKPGAHFSISDVILTGELPQKIKEMAEMYAGCIAGAILKEEYINCIKEAGFKNITLQKESSIILPNEAVGHVLSPDEILTYNNNPIVKSITIYAEK